MNGPELCLRRISAKPGESLLAVLGVAAATVTVAATVSLMGAYAASFDTFSRQPQARQLTVSPAFRTLGEGEAAVRIDTVSDRPVRPTLQDSAGALEEVPGLETSYVARFMRFTTSAASSQMFFFGGPGGGPGGGGPAGPLPGTEVAGAAAAGLEASASAPESADAAPGAAASRTDAPEPVDDPLVEEIQGYQVSPSYFEAYGLRAAQGVLFDDRDLSEGRASAAVGAGLAGRLYADGTALGKRIRLNGTIYRIDAVLSPYGYDAAGLPVSPDDLVYVPTRDAARAGPAGAQFFGGADELSFSAAEGADVAAAAVRLEAYFNRLYGEGVMTVTTELSRLKREMEKRTRILSLLAALAAAVGLAAGVNVFNLMVGRVSRRKGALAIQRSLGSPARAVFLATLAESGLLGLLGCLVGAALSPLLFSALKGTLESGLSGGPAVASRWDLVILVGLAAWAASVLFAVPAALKAAGTPIVDALRDE